MKLKLTSLSIMLCAGSAMADTTVQTTHTREGGLWPWLSI